MNFWEHDVEWTDEKISRFWDYVTQNAALSDRRFGFNAGKHVADVIKKTVKFSKLRNIIDLSCGKGDVLSACFKYLKSGQCCYGTDFSENNVKFVKNRFKDNPLFIQAYLLRDYPSSLPESFFELVILTEVIEHLNDHALDLVLKECNRLLLPGGYIFITTPNNENIDSSKVICPDCGCVFHRWQHVRAWTRNSLKKNMEKYSFHPKLIKQMFWSNSMKERIILKVGVKMKFITPNSLVFVGTKGDQKLKI